MNNEKMKVKTKIVYEEILDSVIIITAIYSGFKEIKLLSWSVL